jgi:hypothetical protein
LFGYGLLVDEAHDPGEPMAERTAWRICSDLGWRPAFGKRREPPWKSRRVLN